MNAIISYRVIGGRVIGDRVISVQCRPVSDFDSKQGSGD